MPVVFTVGVLNFLVGFGLAVLLRQRIVVPIPVLRRTSSNRAAISEKSTTHPARVEDMRDGLPAHWLELLDSDTIQATTLVDAVLEILKVELATYREDLLKTEDQVRGATTDDNTPALQEMVQALVSLNGNWATQQREASRVLSENRDGLGHQAAFGSQMERLLLDQIRTVHAGCRNLSHVQEEDHDSARASVIDQIGHWASMAHHLRDTLLPHTTTNHTDAAQQGPEGPPRQEATRPPHATSPEPSPEPQSNSQGSQPNAMANLPNRRGIELALERWWQTDPRRQRPLTAALIDLDRFGAINKELGIRAGDRILNVLADHLTRLIGLESEPELIYRYGGQSFFLFLADSTPDEAAERLDKTRQTIAATELEYEGQRYSLTFSAGVASVEPDEETTSLFHRLEELTKKAKENGRNRTEREGSTGNQPVESEPPEVPAGVLNAQ